MNPRRWLRSRYFVICCWLVILSSFGSAQNHPRRATVNVPFDFYIAGDKFPAGPYSLEIIAPTYVMLRSADGKLQQALYFLQTAAGGKEITPKVRFALREGKHYFSEVWSWYGKSQLTSFPSQAGDQLTDVPLTP